MTLSQFWQFYQQMEESDRTQTTPDLEDMHWARLKTNEEKGQALLGRFIPQSSQNNFDEKKHILSDISTAHSQKVAPTMKSQIMNSMKHFVLSVGSGFGRVLPFCQLFTAARFSVQAFSVSLSYHDGCFLLFHEPFIFVFLIFACTALTPRLNLTFHT